MWLREGATKSGFGGGGRGLKDEDFSYYVGEGEKKVLNRVDREMKDRQTACNVNTEKIVCKAFCSFTERTFEEANSHSEACEKITLRTQVQNSLVRNVMAPNFCKTINQKR